MDNENKNNNQNNNNNNKNKHHKRKSYFIAPNEPQKQAQTEKPNEQKKPTGESNAEALRPKNQSNNQSNNQGNVNKQKKHKGKDVKNSQNPAQNAQQSQKNAQNPAQNAQQSQKNAQNPAQNAQQSQKGSPSPDASKSASAQNQQKNASKNNRQRQNRKKSNEQTVSQSQASAPASAPLGSVGANNEFPKADRLEKPEPKKLTAFSASPEYEKYKDYQEFTYEELYGAEPSEEPATTVPGDDEEVTTVEKTSIEVVGIKFKTSGKTYYFAPNGIALHVGNHAIVETARGIEFGEVVMSNSFISEDEIIPPLRPVVRAATNEDVQRNADTKKNEEIAFKVCNEKIIAHKLDMKLIDAQYTFDNSKLLFYFTSSGRVDFRELVKDLASVFRTRIELRQIGIRDEAKMIGGLGICGRPLCCSIFLTDFGQVSIKMAKEQSLSLNSAKISGICGRLMCCLRYEHETYEYEIKRTPPVDTLVRTVDGIGTVTETSPLQGTIRVRLAATPEAPPKTYKRDSVTILKKKN